MTDQLPYQGPVKLPCPCGCGKFGTQRVRAWGDGLRHVRGCPCRRCKGSRAKPNAYRRERRIAKDTGGSRDAMSGALSGKDVTAGLWAIEETANEALVRGLRRWWQSTQIRRKMARLVSLHGVARAFVASWDGRPQLVVVPYDDWHSMVAANNGLTIHTEGNAGLPNGAADEQTGPDGTLRAGTRGAGVTVPVDSGEAETGRREPPSPPAGTPQGRRPTQGGS